jgi:O-antigen/teichoic acid export membrane protein
MKIPFLDNMDYHMHELVKGASIVLFLKVFGAGLAFAFNILLARTLGAEGTGLYFLSLTVCTIATVVARIGLDNAITRFTAASAAISDWCSVKGIYQDAARLGITGSVLTAFLMLILAPWLAQDIFCKPELSGSMQWMALSVPPVVVLMLHAQMFRGLKRIFHFQLIHGVAVPALSLFGLYLVGNTWGVNGAVWVYTSAAVVTALVSLWIWHKMTPQCQHIVGHFPYRELLNSSMPLFCVALMNLMMERTGTFMLGIWCEKADVGIFAVASRTAALTSFILAAVNSIAAPTFSAIYSQGDIETLGTIARGSTRMITLMGSPILLLFLFFPERVMSLFGPQFTKAAVVLSILSVGQFVNIASGSVGYLLMMTGHETVVRNNVFFGAGLNVLLNAIFIAKYGILDAAIATASALAIKNVIAVYLVYRYLSIKMWSFRVN